MRLPSCVTAFAVLAAVAGCSSTGTDQTMTSETTTMTTSETASTTPQAPGSSGYGAGSAASRNDTATGVAPQATGTLESATVVSVEPVPRAGIGTMGTSGTSGSSSSSASKLQSYRVTLRMNDGSTRVVTQDWQPRFSAGDRIQLENGQIQNR